MEHGRRVVSNVTSKRVNRKLLYVALLPLQRPCPHDDAPEMCFKSLVSFRLRQEGQFHVYKSGVAVTQGTTEMMVTSHTHIDFAAHELPTSSRKLPQMRQFMHGSSSAIA